MLETSRITTLLLILAALGCGDSGDASASSAPAPTTAQPEPGEPQDAAGSEAAGPALRGSIDIDPLLGAGTRDHACLYLMGWRGIRQGPPQLVRKFTDIKMPISFTLDLRDLAGGGTLSGDWILVARLDGDGEASPAAGDLQGTARGFVTAGGPPARIFLTDELNAEDARHAEWLASPTGAVEDPATPAPKTGPRFRGTITLSESFADQNGTRTLFVMLKDKTLPRGMPRAVLMVDRPQFPFTFDMGVENVPPIGVENPEDLLEGQLYLTARLDNDGSFMGQPGDIELSAPVPMTADQTPVKVALDTRRKN